MLYTCILTDTLNSLLKENTFSLRDFPLCPSFLHNSSCLSYLAPASFTTLLWSVVAAVPCMLCFICGAGDRLARRSPTKRRTSNGSFCMFSQTLNSECLLVCTQEENGGWATEEKRRWRCSLRAMMEFRASHPHLPVLIKDSLRTPGKAEEPQLDPRPVTSQTDIRESAVIPSITAIKSHLNCTT